MPSAVYYKYACFSVCVCLCKQDANTHADLVIIFAVGRGFGASLVFSGLSGLAFACFPAGFCRFLSRVCVVRVCAMAGQIHESMSSAPALPLRLWARVVLPALYCQRIRTASLLRRRKHVHVFSSLLLSSYLCRRMTEHYATMLLCCACAARQVLHQGMHSVY